MKLEENPVPSVISVFEKRIGFAHGELIPTIAAFCYFFFLITAYYVLKPIRESLALELGSGRIPALSIFSMFSLVAANSLYSWIVGKFPREKFIPWITRTFLACLIIFYFLFEGGTTQQTVVGEISNLRKAAIGSYFIWVNLFGLFPVSMFWSFVNDVFTSEQGKRLYATIGFGGLIGGLTGGILTSFLVSHLGTAKMFLVAALLLEPTIWCMRIILKATGGGAGKKTYQINMDGVENPPLVERPAPSALDGLRCTISAPILVFMALEMFLYTFGSSLFSYQLNVLMEKTIESRDQRTIYWANIYNSINSLSLLSQIFLTGRVIRSGSPWIGLAFHPLLQITGSLLLLNYQSLELAAGISVIRYALNYSTGRAVRELFFTPLSQEQKYQAKGFIDTLVFRTGDGLASSLLLSWQIFFPLEGWIDCGVMSVAVISFLVVTKLGKEYANLFKVP